jgi:flagellar M-ring protein FliF
MVELEKVVSDELQDNVRKTLIPYLGLNNFEISVTARLNLDKREINETTYDPESRVERSVRNVKESSSSQNAGNSANVTVEQNIPAEQTAAIPGESSKSQKDRREELSNFELNTKKISTVSNGYKIENLTVAVVLNKRQLLASLGQNPSQDAIDKQIKEVEKVVETAAGLDPARGDRVTVAAVDFIVDTERLDPVPSPDIVDMLMRQMGSFVNAITIVAGIALLIWFGLRPAVRAILEQPQPEGLPAGQTPAIEGQAQGAPPSLPGPALALQEEEEEFALPRPRKTTPQQRLEAIVEANEEAVAAMLKQLLRG